VTTLPTVGRKSASKIGSRTILAAAKITRVSWSLSATDDFDAVIAECDQAAGTLVAPKLPERAR
jgi:hypothetical protein